MRHINTQQYTVLVRKLYQRQIEPKQTQAKYI